MGMKYVHAKDDLLKVPLYGAGGDIAKGAMIKVGATPATDGGLAIKATGASACPDILGRLIQMLDYSVDGESLLDGTAFVTKPIQLAQPCRIFRLEYDLTAASAVVCTAAVTTATMTLTIEDNADGMFIYVVGGTGIGQTNYATADAGTTLTLKAAFGTSLSTDSYFIKILPRFHDIISLSSDGTKLASQAAAGAVKGMILDTLIQRGSRIEQMSPVKHAALTGLNGVTGLHFWADVSFRDTAVYTID
jgi:hypothetical protein